MSKSLEFPGWTGAINSPFSQITCSLLPSEPFSHVTFIKYSLFIISKELKINIDGDKVLDAGGLLREWIFMIIKEVFHPNTGISSFNTSKACLSSPTQTK
jgi:hypothetical protein